MSLGERVKSKRLSLNLSQQELAEKVGVSQQTICDIECGNIKKPRRLVEIARALKCSSGWLYDGKRG